MEDRKWSIEGRVMARKAIFDPRSSILDPRSSIFEAPYLPGSSFLIAIVGGHAGLSEL